MVYIITKLMSDAGILHLKKLFSKILSNFKKEINFEIYAKVIFFNLLSVFYKLLKYKIFENIIMLTSVKTEFWKMY